MKYCICNGSGWYFRMNYDDAVAQVEWALMTRYYMMGWQGENGKLYSVQLADLRSHGVFEQLELREMTLHGPAHCFDAFLRAEDHMKDHPEWFGMRDGKRVPQTFLGSQFCWSNAEA